MCAARLLSLPPLPLHDFVDINGILSWSILGRSVGVLVIHLVNPPRAAVKSCGVFVRLAVKPPGTCLVAVKSLIVIVG